MGWWYEHGVWAGDKPGHREWSLGSARICIAPGMEWAVDYDKGCPDLDLYYTAVRSSNLHLYWLVFCHGNSGTWARGMRTPIQKQRHEAPEPLDQDSCCLDIRRR